MEALDKELIALNAAMVPGKRVSSARVEGVARAVLAAARPSPDEEREQGPDAPGPKAPGAVRALERFVAFSETPAKLAGLYVMDFLCRRAGREGELLRPLFEANISRTVAALAATTDSDRRAAGRVLSEWRKGGLFASVDLDGLAETLSAPPAPAGSAADGDGDDDDDDNNNNNNGAPPDCSDRGSGGDPEQPPVINGYSAADDPSPKFEQHPQPPAVVARPTVVVERAAVRETAEDRLHNDKARRVRVLEDQIANASSKTSSSRYPNNQPPTPHHQRPPPTPHRQRPPPAAPSSSSNAPYSARFNNTGGPPPGAFQRHPPRSGPVSSGPVVGNGFVYGQQHGAAPPRPAHSYGGVGVFRPPPMVPSHHQANQTAPHIIPPPHHIPPPLPGVPSRPMHGMPSSSNNNNNNKNPDTRPAPVHNPDLLKTRMCRSVAQGVTCRFGDKCCFAHSKEEIRIETRTRDGPGGPGTKALPTYLKKTKLCRYFEMKGTCEFGNTCNFAHGPAELRSINSPLPPPPPPRAPPPRPRHNLPPPDPPGGGGNTQRPPPTLLVDEGPPGYDGPIADHPLAAAGPAPQPSVDPSLAQPTTTTDPLASVGPVPPPPDPSPAQPTTTTTDPLASVGPVPPPPDPSPAQPMTTTATRPLDVGDGSFETADLDAARAKRPKLDDAGTAETPAS